MKDGGHVTAYLKRLTGVLRDLETYVSGPFTSIINYAAARRSAEPISAAPTESAVHRLLHRRMSQTANALVAERSALHAQGSDCRYERNIRT
jgi:putative heme iron utilization protein